MYSSVMVAEDPSLALAAMIYQAGRKGIELAFRVFWKKESKIEGKNKFLYMFGPWLCYAIGTFHPPHLNQLGKQRFLCRHLKVLLALDHLLRLCLDAEQCGVRMGSDLTALRVGHFLRQLFEDREQPWGQEGGRIEIRRTAADSTNNKHLSFVVHTQYLSP